MRFPSILLLTAAMLAPSFLASAAHGANSGAVVAMHPEGLRVPLITVPQPDSGALVVLADTRTGGIDLYAQRLDARGRRLLGGTGAFLMSFTSSNFDVRMLDDGAGGAILVANVDGGATGKDIVAWRVAPDGSMAYGPSGLVVCNANRDQDRPFVVAGPAGFFYVAWTDDRPNLGGRYDIYAQKVSLAGVPQWTANGVLVNTTTYRPWSYGIDDMTRDLQGGFILTWTYNSFGGVTRAQRVNASGVVQWTANGVDYGHPSYGARNIAPDGLGGVWGTMSVWNGSVSQFFAYHMAANGTPAFAGGVEYMPAQYSGQSTVFRNASGGCFIYTSFIGGPSQTIGTIYRQELSSAGALLRGTYGDYAGSGSLPVVNDATTAILITTPESTLLPGRRRLRLQKHALDGTPLLPGAGVVLGRHEGAWLDIGLSSTAGMSSNGVIAVSWTDTRYTSPSNTESVNVFGQSFGTTGAPLWPDSELPTLLTVTDAAGDQGGYVRTTWKPSIADDPAARALIGYRVWRAIPETAMAPLAAVRPAGDGMFRVGDRVLLAIQDTYWELVGEQPAATMAGYALTVPTGLDSTASSNADRSFMVEAYDDSTHHWFSDVLVGHSVDNLAPALVSPAAGFYSGGNTTLYWGSVPDADLAAYEVFRGSSPAFVPSPANRVKITTETAWTDVGSGPALYRIAARDVHGNLGPSALVFPSGTVAVDPAAPGVWRLRGEWRSGAVRLTLEVPEADGGRVELFDVSGRRLWKSTFRTDEAGVLEFRAAPGALRAGIFHARVTSDGGRTLTQKVVVLP